MILRIGIFLVLLNQIICGERCRNCKSIVNDVVQQILDTDLMSFQGGDAEYEKKKLVSYRFSETRLLEIIESVSKNESSDKQRHIEELESDIEEWWSSDYIKNPSVNASSLIAKFCIPKFCCKDNHYGPQCKECDKCSLNGGMCNGNGTLTGTGKCECKSDYDGPHCEKCNEKNSFELENKDGFSLCKTCDAACDGCTGESASECLQCHAGYELQDGTCSDINECSKNDFDCKEPSTYCFNTSGSYKCEKCHDSCTVCDGPDSSQCSQCATGYVLKGHSCEDINECENDETLCSGDGESCSNEPGSYSCQCKEGWEKIDNGCQKTDAQIGNKKDEL